ncbi:DUF5787 family protein [Halocatena salina]|uniref:DUF5787 family protein n=1 Tax=Halocatena salina TaxID=2934340 RepID=A0A8U0A5F1_9EURY|nr:DUF5787 family protein [Halocatena salina]UPM44096.1 DUF5787 family protein [Halocatena salina]
MQTSEFTFELRVCQWAERHWPPTSDGSDERVLIARQLGTKHRRWDTIVVETDRHRLAERARFGTHRLDADLLGVVRNAPPEWAYYRDVLPHPGYPWRYVRDAIHTAEDRGILDTRRRGNRIEIRRKWEYPDWVDRIVAIENKPDLDASAAQALTDQLQRDVALALADEVWVATRATGETVEPALLERLPVETGILTVTTGGDRASTGRTDARVVWHPRSLDRTAVGTRILERATDGESDLSVARFEYADPEWKATKRLEIAERAYERGWRSYVDSMRPDCRWFSLRSVDGDVLPWCGANACSQSSAECSGRCSSFEPEPPNWRTRGWPIDGGPGAALKRLLADQRRRHRIDHEE